MATDGPINPGGCHRFRLSSVDAGKAQWRSVYKPCVDAIGLTKHEPETMVGAVDRAATPPRTPEEYLDERISRTDPGDRSHRAPWIHRRARRASPARRRQTSSNLGPHAQRAHRRAR